MNFEQRLLCISFLTFSAVFYLASIPVSGAEGGDCAKFNSSCGDCTEHAACYWCSSTKKCTNYPGWTKIVPRDCPSKKWYYGQCWITGSVLIILVPSLVGVFLVVVGCCVYCCCCRQCQKCKKKRMDKEDAKLKRKRAEMQAINAQKRSEREVKRDQIRQKYGLRPGGSSGYQRIEDPS
ncbi:pituitary tumor-transforming gene 1 protein-interacting protein-like [Acropora millepora]|uniref:pituitary tumor-transforming gene 1 protein-interacting protein-like n=1 Tax=Acropora millepora TaxID=45264 RepID=UPI001CF2939F|nr:pituitary tumor-transforming gene 1 protein-interacting protein-like [Acropora millepora]